MVRKQSTLVGGRLCLDFVNTLSWRGADTPRENLDSYVALAKWSARAGAVSKEVARQLVQDASRQPKKAKAVLNRALELREASYRVLDAWRRRRRPNTSDVETLNSVAPARDALEWRHGTINWRTKREHRLDVMLWSIVWSTADLLIDGERGRVKSCGSAECCWLFYDESRAARRRWCSMSDCGNRAKAKRFYARAARERLSS